MGFIMKKGAGTEAVLLVLHDHFIAKIKRTAHKPELFGPGTQLSKASMVLGVYADIASSDNMNGKFWADAWQWWLEWLYDKGGSQSFRFRAHERIRQKIYECLMMEPPRSIWHDWEEQTSTRADGADVVDRVVGGELYLKAITRKVPKAAVDRFRRKYAVPEPAAKQRTKKANSAATQNKMAKTAASKKGLLRKKR